MKPLPVPFRKQELANSCFPACVRMTLKYYGFDINEKNLYGKSMIPPWKGTWDVLIAQELIKKGFKVTTGWSGNFEKWNIPRLVEKKYWKEYAKAILQGMNYIKKPTLFMIQSYLYIGVPVMVEVHAGRFYKKKYDFTHMILLTGYNTKYFFYHDPDKKLGGKNKKITRKRFIECWETIYPGAGRSIFIVERKSSPKSKDL